MEVFPCPVSRSQGTNGAVPASPWPGDESSRCGHRGTRGPGEGSWGAKVRLGVLKNSSFCLQTPDTCLLPNKSQGLIRLGKVCRMTEA